jgi:uncharacterized membrane-anchored protein YhcB (DUF1043 family)
MIWLALIAVAAIVVTVAVMRLLQQAKKTGETQVKLEAAKAQLEGFREKKKSDAEIETMDDIALIDAISKRDGVRNVPKK